MTHAVARGTSGWVMGAEAGRRVPTAAVVLGLVFATIGALLVAIGGIGPPAASVLVGQMPSITPAQQAEVAALARVAPFVLGFGVVHVIVGLGLMLGRAWGRPTAAGLASAVTTLALLAIVVVANNVDSFVGRTASTARDSATTMAGLLAVVAATYVLAAIAAVATRPLTERPAVSPGWWAGESDRSMTGGA